MKVTMEDRIAEVVSTLDELAGETFGAMHHGEAGADVANVYHALDHLRGVMGEIRQLHEGTHPDSPSQEDAAHHAAVLRSLAVTIGGLDPSTGLYPAACREALYAAATFISSEPLRRGDPVYVVVMDDNASDTPLATVEWVTTDPEFAEARRATLLMHHAQDGIEITITKKELS